MMMNKRFFYFTLLFLLSGLLTAASGQNKRNQRPNSGEKTGIQTVETKPAADKPAADAKTGEVRAAFVYEFSQPAFVISHIRIAHDENGRGTITFQKKDFDEEFTDPIELSPVTLEKLKTHFDALDFLESTEDYQFEKDYSHLGNLKITMRSKEGKERTAAFNWTTNADAKAIADEYRKLANQYIWMFDITVARANQPLETPRIMKALDGYIKRDAISDPAQMIPFLKDLSDDERVPLITRNNAAKLIEEIEKKKND